MRIDTMFSRKDVTFSFEVFPPKADAAYEPVAQAVRQMSEYRPDFISVTYGAGGGTSRNTVNIASYIQNDLNTASLAHLSCASSTKEEVAFLLNELKDRGIKNILALRGDIPQGHDFPSKSSYRYAYQLVEEAAQMGSFCIGAACYPEGHVESENKDKDLDYLKLKVDSGCDFLVTQMFFDNNVLYTFMYNALRKGIDLPISAGVMPVTNKAQIGRIIEMSGTSLTPKFKAILDKFGDKPESLKQAGIVYATEQIVDLVANGIKGIHIYTMNKPEVAQSIVANLSSILCSD
ncbi:MAG TPA: methylenetetrahydrofolate reductase [NAD(P)H] [Clostridiales bacterium]|nr:methylenetetrahydrofolate reductase [NAD(P)H] [Clostridiales bacterium]